MGKHGSLSLLSYVRFIGLDVRCDWSVSACVIHDSRSANILACISAVESRPDYRVDAHLVRFKALTVDL